MMMMGPRTAAEREIDNLERELENTTDPAERREIMRALRDVGREDSERERWEDEGRDRGWT